MYHVLGGSHKRGGSKAKMDKSGNFDKPYANVLHAHFDKRTPHIFETAKHLKTVIPLRHPALVAVSWKKRKQQGERVNFIYEWREMTKCPGFRFPIETKPYDELEEYLGRPVIRIDEVVGSLGDYPEKESLDSAREYLGEEQWKFVEEAMCYPYM